MAQPAAEPVAALGGTSAAAAPTAQARTPSSVPRALSSPGWALLGILRRRWIHGIGPLPLLHGSRKKRTVRAGRNGGRIGAGRGRDGEGGGMDWGGGRGKDGQAARARDRRR